MRRIVTIGMLCVELMLVAVPALWIPEPANAPTAQQESQRGHNEPLCGASGTNGWVTQLSGTTNDLTGVDFVNATCGWAVGFEGTILHTADGGQTWNAQVSGTTNDLNAVDFVNGTMGWVVGNDTVLTTTNGGATWNVQTPNGTPNLFAINMIDANNGWCGGNDTLYSTSSGGATWNPEVLPSPGLWITGIAFLGTLNGWMVDSTLNVYNTTNGGISW